MAERLALGVIPGAEWRAAEIQDVARAAEDAGFGAVFCAEVNIDVIAAALVMGLATRRLKVGSWVAHTYLRLPYLCAKEYREAGVDLPILWPGVLLGVGGARDVIASFRQ